MSKQCRFKVGFAGWSRFSKKWIFDMFSRFVVLII